MTAKQQAAAAKEFAKFWEGKGYEKGESQTFWLTLLRDVYGIQHPEQMISFEDQVHLDHTSFIDGYISSTKVMIEQKGVNKDLNRAIKQSDGTYLTPFKQAKRYISELPLSMHPKWVVTCNFAQFQVYDMENPQGEPEVIELKNLEKEYYRLSFLVDIGSVHIQKEMEVSKKAGDIVGILYDMLRSKYKEPDSEESLRSLNMLCVRLVFCLYAEDAGIFGKKTMFHDYMAQFEPRFWREKLKELFKVLDQKPENRDPYMEDKLADFPYVNGGLFEKEDIEIPNFTEEICKLILKDASADFDWSEISPVIFGAIFESTLNAETRRSGGMHYTSVENIHKVIDPLFLDDLTDKYESIFFDMTDDEKQKVRDYEKALEKLQKEEAEAHRKNDDAVLKRIKKDYQSLKNAEKRRSNLNLSQQIKALDDLQDEIASLKFLDPAAGSGNFLTLSYICLRRLENKIIAKRQELMSETSGSDQYAGQIALGQTNNPIKVSIQQFCGIEIHDFAVTVAKTALWIAESQMMKETEKIIHMNLDFLPLKTNAYIVEGNALQMDWENVISKKELTYLMGNPPFIGYKLQTTSQKSDLRSYYGDTKNIDYVAGWYYKAAQFINDTDIKCAFVSTNSVTQGEQVNSVWRTIYENYRIHIDFAYRTFIWDSEADSKAHVHCVIIGFSSKEKGTTRKLYSDKGFRKVNKINPYLIEADNLFIEKLSHPLCDCEKMIYGSEPREGGYLILSEEEKLQLLKETPAANKLIKRFVSSEDYINNKIRYCLWITDADLEIARSSKFILERLKKCKEFRENSKQAQAHAAALTPHLFASPRQPNSNYLLIPVVSSGARSYIPIGYLDADTVASNACFTIPNASLYTFGIITSNVHMAWMRTLCGRLKSDYRYSNSIVYNNFIWPNFTEAGKEKIEETAKEILNIRKKYPDRCLASLYDDLTMPSDLRKAHQLNDKAVLAAYGIKPGDAEYKSESACVAMLMKLYQKKIEELKQADTER